MTISIDQPPEPPFRLKLAGRNTFCGRVKDRLEFHPSLEILPHFATPSEPNLASAIDGLMPDIVLLSTNIPVSAGKPPMDRLRNLSFGPDFVKPAFLAFILMIS